MRLVEAKRDRSPPSVKIQFNIRISSKGRTVPKITIEVSEELSLALTQVGDSEALLQADRLPELLRLSLQQPALPAHIYRYILNFLASNPTPEEIADFRPTPEMQERLCTLLGLSKAGKLSPTEQKELDEYEQIEHLVIMLKTGSLAYLIL